MYVTWDLLLTFCMVMVDFLALVLTIFQNNKKK